MKKKLYELTREEYETLYRSGMMGEFYPDASGCYEKDVEEYNELLIAKQHKKEFVRNNMDEINSRFIYLDRTTFVVPLPKEAGFIKYLLTKDEFEEICSELAEERMNVIGQNGNDGEHYKGYVTDTGYTQFTSYGEFERFKKDFVDANSLDGFNLGTYQRAVKDKVIDIYDILELYKVYNPATAHAIKKLLMPGQRGNKGVIQDLEEAKQSITRAIELEKSYHDAD